MIFSEDNYGRFEAMAFVVGWFAVGSSAAFLLVDVIVMFQQGLPPLRGLFASALAAGLLVWCLRGTVTSLQEMREFIDYHEKSLSRILVNSISSANFIFGFLTIYLYRTYFLLLIEQSASEYSIFTINAFCAAIAMPTIVFISWLQAWFVIFPKKTT